MVGSLRRPRQCASPLRPILSPIGLTPRDPALRCLVPFQDTMKVGREVFAQLRDTTDKVHRADDPIVAYVRRKVLHPQAALPISRSNRSWVILFNLPRI